MKSTHKLYMLKRSRRAILVDKNYLFKPKGSKMYRKDSKKIGKHEIENYSFNLCLKIA